MYKLIRNVHLALGLIVTPFLLTYAISAAFYSHHFLNFSSKETKVEKFTLATVSKNPVEMADLLSKEYGIRGVLRRSSINELGLMELEISRTGHFYKFEIDTNSGVVASEERVKDAIGFIAALHTVGFRNNYSYESWWGYAVTVVSVLIILTVVTGLFLWISRKKDRLSGGMFLSASVVYCMTVLSVLYSG